MNVINRFLLENIFFSEKSLLIDKSKIKSQNLLVIIGISGSGKTTLGKKIAEKLNAYYVSSDEWEEKWYDEHEEKIEKYLKEKDYESYEKLYNECFKRLKNYIDKFRKNKLVIAEGVHLCDQYENSVFNKQWACQFSFIVLRKSLLTAAYRGFKRTPKYALKNPKSFARHFFSINHGSIKIIEKFVKERLKCAKEISELKNDNMFDIKDEVKNEFNN